MRERALREPKEDVHNERGEQQDQPELLSSRWELGRLRAEGASARLAVALAKEGVGRWELTGPAHCCQFSGGFSL
jgi:hypothetical protein